MTVAFWRSVARVQEILKMTVIVQEQHTWYCNSAGETHLVSTDEVPEEIFYTHSYTKNFCCL